MPSRDNTVERDRDASRDISGRSRGRGDPPGPTPTEQERAKQDKPGNRGNTGKLEKIRVEIFWKVEQTP